MDLKEKTLNKIKSLADTGYEEVLVDYIKECSDSTGFDGSMKDMSDILEIPLIDVLKFHNRLFEVRLIKRTSFERHEFMEK